MPSTGTYYIDALIQNNAVGGLARWGSSTISYGFMTSMGGGYFWNNFGMTNFRPFNTTQRDGARRALGLVADVAHVTFSDRGNNDGDLFFGTANFNNPGIAGRAFYPGQNFGFVDFSGDVWLNHQVASNLDQTPGSKGFHTMIHEVGHALGLKHPGNYDNDPAPYLPTSQDSYQYSVMSYNFHPQQGSAFPQTLMLYDVAAIQYLYGPNLSTRTGNDTYSWDPNRNVMMTIWDAGGQDTISAANQTLGARINLNAGGFSSIGPRWHGSLAERATNNIAIAFGVTIENATGGLGNDALYGNSVRNMLFGGAGNDSLYGYGGNDFLSGGDGNDYLWSGTGNDSALGGAGNDFLSGDADQDNLIGGTGNDWILGGSGNDALTGDAGNDTLSGGIGGDRFTYQTYRPFTTTDLGIDTITDFTSGTDKIVLGKETFTALWSVAGNGFSSIRDFAVVLSDIAATTSGAAIVYNSTNGKLFYNQNTTSWGLGTGGHFATLSNRPVLSGNDFVLTTTPILI